MLKVWELPEQPGDREVSDPTCVCGGTADHPNDDCERCGLVAEVAELRRFRKLASDASGGIGRRDAEIERLRVEIVRLKARLEEES